MFGLKLTAIVGIAGLLLATGAYFKGRSDGKDAENNRWSAVAAQQKAEAASLLASETAKVIAAERRLSTVTAEIEATHVKAKNDLAAAGSKYDRLGKLFEQTRARCGGGSGGTAGADTATAAVDPGGTDPGEDVLGAGGRAFQELIFDADRMRTAFMACREYVTALPVSIGRQK